jgi:hypothetical protein
VSSAVQTLLFSRSGTNPVEISPQIESVAWRLNQTGQAKLYLSYTDPLCTPDNLRLGKRVLMNFENGLPPFGGVIDVPRQRRANGVAFTVYTGDRILSWRRTAKTRAFTSTAPGIIYQTLIEDENAESGTGIAIGSIYTGGTARSETYHLHNVLDVILQLQRLSGEEFEVVPVYQKRQLTFLANWKQRIGSDISDEILLVEDRNIEPPALDEQGPIASRVLCAGGAAGDDGWDDRLVGEDTSTTSRNEYGYREYAEVITGVFDQTTLDASATSVLDELDAPRERFSIAALNREPATFGDYDVGDTVTLQAFLQHPLWAVDRALRIVGREWTPADICRLEFK